jgi:hypothetical protein
MCTAYVSEMLYLQGVGRRMWTRTGVYISLKIVDTVWFLVRKVDPYYGKYKGTLAN